MSYTSDFYLAMFRDDVPRAHALLKEHMATTPNYVGPDFDTVGIRYESDNGVIFVWHQYESDAKFNRMIQDLMEKTIPFQFLRIGQTRTDVEFIDHDSMNRQLPLNVLPCTEPHYCGREWSHAMQFDLPEE